MKQIGRDSCFEILRIIAILFVVSGHTILLTTVDKIGSCEYFVYNGIRCIVDCAVDLFVLISGYWGIRFRIGKLLRLFFQSMFYSTFLYFVGILIHGDTPIWHKDFLIFLPIINGNPWFVATYAALFCLSPFLNLFVSACHKDQYKTFLLVGFILFYLWPTFSFLFNSRQLVNDAGFGIVNFTYLYLLGRYISLYYRVEKKQTIIYICSFLFIGFLLLMTHFCVSELLGFEFNSYFSYNTVFVLSQAVMLILVFKKLSIKGIHNVVINKIASYSVAVYFFHTLLLPYFKPDKTAESLLFYATITPFIIYILTIPIEQIRQFLFGRLEDWMIYKVENTKLGQMFFHTGMSLNEYDSFDNI